MMELGFQNFSQASPLHGLNRFQDYYYPPHLYEPPKITTERPREYYNYAPKVPVAHEASFSDRIFGTTGGWGWGEKYDAGPSSAAVSALGLLSFLFFLNLLQTSLLRTRMPTTNMTMPGRRRRALDTSPWTLPSFDDIDSNGKKRQRRSDDLDTETPLSITFDPNDHNDTQVFNFTTLQDKRNIFNSDKIRNWKLNRFKRQMSANRTTVQIVPVKCVVQLYACVFYRRLQATKKRFLNLNFQQPFGLARKIVVIPVRNQAGVGNSLLQERFVLARRKSCRVLFNECRNATLLLTPTG